MVITSLMCHFKEATNMEKTKATGSKIESALQTPYLKSDGVWDLEIYWM